MPDREGPSRAIWQRFLSLPEYRAAATVMLYVDAPGEVRTQPFVAQVIAAGKRIVVPYCETGELGLFHLEAVDELAPGHFGILEPRPELRTLAGKRVSAAAVDVVMVPGVAFDRRGGRLGYGKGYYDRLLRRAPPSVVAVGVAFRCQVFPEVPMMDHDAFLDRIITDEAVYEGRGR